MPALKNYRLFIGHAWQYNEDYDRLVEMLDSAKFFKWTNYSVPQDRPKEATDDSELRQALRNQMRSTNCILIISGMYVAYRDWIQHEIDVAAEWGKPVIGIRPRGNERVPRAVSSVADVMVGWYTPSIISEIRKRAK